VLLFFDPLVGCAYIGDCASIGDCACILRFIFHFLKKIYTLNKTKQK